MKLFLRSILFFAFAGFAPLAMAQQAISYTNSNNADNSFENGNNWTTAFATGTVPGPNNTVYIFPGFQSSVDTTGMSGLIIVTPGGSSTITLAAADNHTIDSLLVSGNFLATQATNPVFNLNFSGSTLTLVGTLGFAVVGNAVMNFQGNLTDATGDVAIGSASNEIDSFQTSGPGTLNLSNGTVNLDGTSTFFIGQGTTGTVSQDATSVVITGATTNIGDVGNGTYNVAVGGVLDLGTQGAPLSASYTLNVGESAGAVGNLNLAGTLNANNPNTTIAVGDGGTGTVDQTGTVTINGANSALDVGGSALDTSGGSGTYILDNPGTLVLGTTGNTDELDIGVNSGSSGTFNQIGGALTAGTTSVVIIGDAGAGTYQLSAGTADFQNGFVMGNALGSTGIVQQSGGTLTAENNTVFIGGSGTGLYNMSGGTATFNAGVVIGGIGAVQQTGGTFTVPAGQTLDLSALGSVYSLGGSGVLQIDINALVGTTGEGVLNFAGGTLQIIGAGGAFTDALDSSMSNVSTIDAATTPGITSVTLSGNLSGTGGLNFVGGAGTIFGFLGTNTYTGSTTITSGILNASSDQVMDSSSLNVGAAGTFNLTVDTGGFAYAGGLGGAGAFNVIFATGGDSFVVLNPVSLTGPVTIGDGILQVYSGTLGPVSGPGGLTLGGAPNVAFPVGTVIPTAGTLTLAPSTYAGPTIVNSGFLLYGSSLTGTGGVTNNGTIALTPTSAIGSTFTIGGDFTQNLGGAFVVRTNGAINDSYSAATATLDGKVVLAGGIPAGGAAYTIVTTGGLVTGTLNDPAGLQVISSFLETGILSQVGNDLVVTVSPNPIVGTTPTQNAVAGALNANPNNPIFARINTPNFNNPNFYDFTAADAPAILQQLSPQVLEYARQIDIENATFLVERMNAIDANLRASYGGLDTSAINIVNPGFNTGLGRSMGQLVASNDPAFHNAAPNGVNYYPGGQNSVPSSAAAPESAPTWDSSSQVISDSPNPYLATQQPSGPETPGFSEFISGDAILADLNQNSSDGTSKASYTAGDATAGVSFRMNSHLAMGVLFDYNHTDAKTDNAGSKTKIDSYTPGLFATYFDHGFYVNGLFSFGYNTYDNTRVMPLFGSTASSHPNGQQYVADLDTGYDFHPDKAWIVGPTLGLTYTHVDIDSFTESGAEALGADLAVQNQNVDSLRSRLGAHAIYQTYTGDVLLQPNISLMWQHEFLDDGDGITSSFSDFASSPFTIATDKLGKDSALIGIGLTATLSNSMSLYIDYLADVGASDYWAQSVIGGLKARF